MGEPGESTSVFTDDSGARARVLVWGTRGALALVVVVGIVLGFSMVAQVTLPGLDGPVHLPGAGTSKAKNADQPSPADPSSAPADPAATPATGAPGPITAGSTSGPAPGRPGTAPSTGPGTAPGTTPSSVPSAAPSAPGSAHSPHASSQATAAPRATPTHAAGGPTATPPGKAKR